MKPVEVPVPSSGAAWAKSSERSLSCICCWSLYRLLCQLYHCILGTQFTTMAPGVGKMQAWVRLLPPRSCPCRASPPVVFLHSGGLRGRLSHSSGLCLAGDGVLLAWLLEPHGGLSPSSPSSAEPCPLSLRAATWCPDPLCSSAPAYCDSLLPPGKSVS